MHSKSITELCDLDATLPQKFQIIKQQSPISYTNFVRKDVQPQKKLPQKHNLLVRSHNVTPSVGHYQVSYESLQKHSYTVKINSEPIKRSLKISTTNNQVIQVPESRSVNSIDFNKQLSREYMYATRGWLKFDKSMVHPEKTLSERIEDLRLGEQLSRKFPQIIRPPQMDVAITHLPYNNEKMEQITTLYQNKYKLKLRRI